MKTIHEADTLPVRDNVDILVIGGGPAGVAAGFAAARMGAKTLIVEQYNCLGGVATAAACNHIELYSSYRTDERVVGGIPFEMARRVSDAGYGVHSNTYSYFEAEGMKRVLEQMAEESSTSLLYHTFFCDSIVEDGKIVGAIVQSKSGREVIKAKQVIDCTGDGDVAAKAGCEYKQGDEETGACQPVTLMFTIGGVDFGRFREHCNRLKDYKLRDIWVQAQQAGDMRPFQTQPMGWWWTPTRPDQVGVNFTHVIGIDSTNADDITRATLEARRQAYEAIAVFRKYVQGMEKCYMVSTPNTIGLRESRRILGDYYLTKDDILSQKEFDDSIGYGSFFIDIHNCTGPGMDKKAHRPDPGFKYHIPYRILLPKDVDNLLVAGRCVSCSHEALGSLRVMAQCGVMGQAAGVAAVQSIRANLTPRRIGVPELQEELRRQQCLITSNDIVDANANQNQN